MVAPRSRARVLLPACRGDVKGMPANYVGRKYLEAVALAGAQPLIVADADPGELAALLDIVDGIFLTGSPSNVHPSHYGAADLEATPPLDAARDHWVLPLVRLALERGVPLFGVCRGLQEINVALGGTLHQAVHDVPGHADHRAGDDPDPEHVYGPAHEVHVAPGGLLEQLLGKSTLRVNSIHAQGVARLASCLRVEARAPDGLVEAFTFPDAPAFNLAVQWHPEWRAVANPVSQRLLRAFGDACRARHENLHD